MQIGVAWNPAPLQLVQPGFQIPGGVFEILQWPMIGMLAHNLVLASINWDELLLVL